MRALCMKLGRRLAILALVVWLVASAAEWLVGSWIVHRGEALLGLNIEAQDVDVDWLDSSLEVRDVRLASPGASTGGLDCERIVVDVEGAPFARRKLIVRNATATGVSLRTDSGEWALPPAAEPPASWTEAFALKPELAAWFRDVENRLQNEPSAASESYRLIGRVRKLLPLRLLELQDELAILELRLQWLSELHAEAQSQSASGSQSPERISEQVFRESLRTLTLDWQELREKVTELRLSWQADRQRIIALHDADADQHKPPTALPTPDADLLARYFLGAEMSRQAWKVLNYVEWGRQFLPSLGADCRADDDAGMTIFYPGQNPLPDFLVKAFHFQGQVEMDAKSVAFAGSLQNITHEPRRLGQPMRLVLDLQAPHRIVVEALVDPTGDTPRQRIVVRAPAWMQPETSWGRSNGIALESPAGLMSMRAEVNLVGDKLQGTVRLKRQQVELAPHVARPLGGQATADVLADLLSGVESLDAEVRLSGTLAAPQAEFKAHDAPRISHCVYQAVTQELARRNGGSLTPDARGFDEQLMALDNTLDVEQKQLLERAASGESQVRALISSAERPVSQARRHPLRHPDAALDRTRLHPLR